MHRCVCHNSSIKSTSTFATSLIGLLLLALLSPPAKCSAEDINWVGYQYGPPGGGVANFSNDASFFHGDQWLNYKVPGSDDAAIFDDTFDPQNNGTPHNVLFGDFTVPVIPIYHPQSETILGGDAVVRELVMRNGAFDFYFSDQLGTPQGSVRVTQRLFVADQDNTSATLTIRDGTLTTDAAVHLAPSVGSQAAVIVDGPSAKWVHNYAADVGWVGEGSITIKNGGTMESRFELQAGIRNGSVGKIDVLSGGKLTLAEKGLNIGRGHEATGSASGVMRVIGNGSHASAPWLGVGSSTAAGTVLISDGGDVEISGTTLLNAASGRESGLTVSGVGASLHVGQELKLTGDNSSVMVVVDDRAEAHASFAGVDSLNAGGAAKIVVRNEGLLTVDSFVSLSGNGNSTIDVRDGGRMEVGALDAPAELGEIRIGAGGWFRGSGTILGDLTIESDGVFEPGFSPGVFNIAGDLTFLDERPLTLEIGGTTPGLFDQINVTGDFSFGGTLQVSFINGFLPSNLDSFDLITVGGESLRGFNVEFLNVPAGLVSAEFVDGAYRVSAVPEPSTFCLLGIALATAYPVCRRTRLRCETAPSAAA